MKSKHKLAVLSAALAVVGAWGTLTFGSEQPAPIKRTVLLKDDTSIPDREGIVALVELAPGAAEDRHTHPAELYGYVLEGTSTLEIEGQPTVTLKPGDAIHIPQGKAHRGMNTGTTPGKLIAFMIAEKDKPLSSPAP